MNVIAQFTHGVVEGFHGFYCDIEREYSLKEVSIVLFWVVDLKCRMYIEKNNKERIKKSSNDKYSYILWNSVSAYKLPTFVQVGNGKAGSQNGKVRMLCGHVGRGLCG